MQFDAFDSYVAEPSRGYFDEVAELCALPSVSAQKRMLRETADWVRARLERAGFRTDAVSAPGSAPAVWAEAGEGERTLLLYNHYDVQPAEPLDLWQSDPFTLTERGENLYARGVADNKGDLLTRLHAIEAWLATQGDLPCRIRWLIEGEEEIGSLHLGEIVARHGERWGADGCLWEGAGYDEDDKPAVYCGARGLLYVELRVRTLERDLHSMYGGIVPNALWRLVGALATLRDPSGRILVKGLREAVEPLGAAERDATAAIPFDAAEMRKSLGAPHILGGLDGSAAVEELVNAPTINVAGLWGGYTGGGPKTVIPAAATAKLDIRLVPGLTADGAEKLLVEHLRTAGFDDIEVVRLSGVDPARTPVDHPVVRLAERVWRDISGEAPRVYPSMPGSGPAAVVIRDLGVPTVLTGGVGWHGDRIHSPNESIRTRDYVTAVRYWGRYIDGFSRI